MPTDRDEPPGGCAGASDGDGYTDALVQSLVAVYDSCRGRTAEEPSPRESRAVAWARVSTEEQQRKGLSIPEQLRGIRAYASQRGIQIVAEYSEAASAFQHDGRRVEFQRMLAAVNSDPTVGVILVHDYSRFSRESLKARLLIRDLQETGVRVVSLNDPPLDRDTPAGVLLEAITFAKNEAFSREISFHVRKGLRANLQTRDPETGWCYKNGGWPPWGYRPVSVAIGTEKGRPIMKRLWALDETVVSGKPVHEWIRYCLVELAGKGATLEELCAFCERANLPPTRQRRSRAGWNLRLLPRSLLTYSGFALWGLRAGQRRPSWPPSDWGVVEHAHPAIITVAEAVAIAEVRRRLDRNPGRCIRDSPRLLGGGMVTCVSCGRRLIVHRASYLCRTRERHDGIGRRYRAEPLEGQVLEGLRDLMSTLCKEPGLLDRANAELQTAWEQDQARRADSLPRAHTPLAGLSGLTCSSDAMGQWEPAGLALASAGADQACTTPTAPPSISRRAVVRCRAATEKALLKGGFRTQKLWVRGWVQAIHLDPEATEVRIRYRIPDEAIIPPGVGQWCAEHSAALSGILSRTFALEIGRAPCRGGRRKGNPG